MLHTSSNTEDVIQRLRKEIDELNEKLEKYGEENGVKVVKCNVNENPKLSNAFKIKSIPFTIVVMPDEKLKYPDIGLRDDGYYFGIIDKLSGKGSFFSRLFS